MPNHVINIIDIEESEQENIKTANDVLKAVKTEKSEFDFNTIIPMPEELRGTKSPANIVPDNEYEEEKKKVEELNLKNPHFNIGLPISESMSKSFLKRYGAINWYDWAIKNWDTKWNAYDIRVNKYGKIVFKTAWSHPYLILIKLSEMFPDFIFHVGYADEDLGENLGIYKIQNGRLLYEMSIGEEDTEELARVLWGSEIFPEEDKK